MSRGDEQILQDLLETAEKLEKIVAKGFDHFATDIEGQWAIERALLNIGEYATNLSPAFKDSYSDIAWKEIIGMRTILAHAYHMIDSQRVWNAAAINVPELINALKK